MFIVDARSADDPLSGHRYCVGGAVRDRLLGLPIKDRDYVVVGVAAEDLLALGYRPVGQDFPVFLHPITHEEHALARTEKKKGHGYRGFTVFADPDVSLEEDLGRRDLTINAMAETEEGHLIDPYGGLADLEAKLLRHVGPHFSEDPVRILRVARFAARFGFTVAPLTQALMVRMVEAGEADHLVPERVWQEISKGLMERWPSRMFTVLRRCGALYRLLPEVDALFGLTLLLPEGGSLNRGLRTLLALDAAASASLTLSIRFAVLSHDVDFNVSAKALSACAFRKSDGPIESVCKRLRVPGKCRDLARLLAQEHKKIQRGSDFCAEELLKLFERCDAFRKPARFQDLLTASACASLVDQQAPALVRLREAFYAAQQLDIAPAASAAISPTAVREAVFQARALAIGTYLRGAR